MRVPDQLRECVCFLDAVRTGSEPNGTEVSSGFFVGVRLGEYGGHTFSYLYAVTARHCIEGTSETNGKFGPPDQIRLRVNTREGPPEDVKSYPWEWKQHPNTDVAILPLGLSLPPQFQFVRWDVMDSSATEEVVDRLNIGPGDDVFLSGLLVNHPGNERNMPIVRLGCIAAMPSEPIHLRTGTDIVALVEARSIGGISGSPVFVHLPFWRDGNKGDLFVMNDDVKAGSGGESWLLGVMHGYFKLPNDPDPDPTTTPTEGLNTGIAIVTRIDRVLSLLSDPERIKERAVEKKKLEDAMMPEMTSATVTTPKEPVDMDARVSLDGIDPDDALRALLDTPPDPRS